MRKIGSKYIKIDARSCTACWDCVEACPKKALGKVKVLWHRHVRFSDSAACVGCGKCIKVCPNHVFGKID